MRPSQTLLRGAFKYMEGRGLATTVASRAKRFAGHLRRAAPLMGPVFHHNGCRLAAAPRRSVMKTALAGSPPVVMAAPPITVMRGNFLQAASLRAIATPTSCVVLPALLTTARYYHGPAPIGRPTSLVRSPKKGAGQLQGVNSVQQYREEEEEQRQEEDPFTRNSGPGYLPFPPPFHTINIIMFLLLANVVCHLLMMFGTDDMRDFIVEHFTVSHENWHRFYPLLTNALYQENTFQMLIDCWLLWQFGDTMLGFLGNMRLTFFAVLCTLGGSLIHVARQKFELSYGMDELEVRGRCYGPNPFIMGLIAIEGLIFRHLNFIQQPPVPFLVLTAFVMVIDVWRIFTMRPEEHGAATGGALMAYLFWALPTRMLGLDKLTATL